MIADVYFIGERDNKPGASAAAQNNFGLDGDDGNYKLFPNDQLAFRYQVGPSALWVYSDAAQVLKMLGQGSFGQVVECLDHKTGKHVALKVLSTLSA